MGVFAVMREENPSTLQMLASMVKVSLLGFAVGGAFLSLAYWDMPFYLLVVVVVLHAHVTTVMGRLSAGRLAVRLG